MGGLLFGVALAAASSMAAFRARRLLPRQRLVTPARPRDACTRAPVPGGSMVGVQDTPTVAAPPAVALDVEAAHPAIGNDGGGVTGDDPGSRQSALSKPATGSTSKGTTAFMTAPPADR